MEAAGSHPGPGQAAVSAQLSPGAKGAPQETWLSRFFGAGVRYKAKLIGVDPVPEAQGDKMCWDSMMKLKGCEVAARRQGKHKLRVWLSVSCSGVKITDERTGAVLYDHDRSRISFLRRDDSDPRALAYVYEDQDVYSLFYIKTANLAGPVLADIDVVCQCGNLETLQGPSEEPTQTSSLLLLENVPAPPVEGSAAEDAFGPPPSTEQPSPASPSRDLMEVFTVQTPTLTLCDGQPIQPDFASSSDKPSSSLVSAPPQPKFSNSQILSIFPQHPAGGSPYSPPPYPPAAVAWGQPRFLGNQWPGPAVAPWPTLPTGIWANSGVQPEAQGFHPGVAPPTSSLNVSGNPPNSGPDLLQ